MAKWGEGDPRWIVEERPDATNVNNWHWTEKNASSWSQDRIKELFTNITVPSDKAALKIDSVEKCEGEACVNNRKGKLIFFYEWNITLNWSGELHDGSDTIHKGTINIPNLSEENDISDLDIQVKLNESTDEGDKLKTIMLKQGKKLVSTNLEKYINKLKQEFSQGMILPKKNEAASETNIKTLASGFNKKVNMAPIISDNVSVGSKINTTTVTDVIKFHCTANDFYNGMTKVEMVTAFTRSNVVLEPVKNGKFELFGGNITGVFEELVPSVKIVQKWRYKQWPSGHFSTVTLDIHEKDDHTEVHLVQEGVPTSEAETTKNNWSRYYWDAMRQTFGFGAFIL